jgi:aspartyl aminopeptidase
VRKSSLGSLFGLNKKTHKLFSQLISVGAAGPILGESVKRISSSLNTNGDASIDMYEATIRKSFVLSSDQAHALHPNYANKHEKNHQPQMNDGMVIKRNANQRYATTGVSGVIMREVARRASLPPVQEFIVRQGTSKTSFFPVKRPLQSFS